MTVVTIHPSSSQTSITISNIAKVITAHRNLRWSNTSTLRFCLDTVCSLRRGYQYCAKDYKVYHCHHSSIVTCKYEIFFSLLAFLQEFSYIKTFLIQHIQFRKYFLCLWTQKVFTNPYPINPRSARMAVRMPSGPLKPPARPATCRCGSSVR